MKVVFTFVVLLMGLISAFGQNEQSPIVEKEIAYKNWTYKNVKTGDAINLRDFAKGKKLVMVVYYAPWCPNWRHDAPMLERFYEKYRSSGLEIIAVGEYDPVTSMRSNLDELKITFPAVYESEARDARLITLHYAYRQATGDKRKWGSPWYIFLEPSLVEKKGEILLTKASVINGEIIEPEGEKFIRQKLGLASEGQKASTATKETNEVCDPEKQTTAFKKPDPKP